MKQKNY